MFITCESNEGITRKFCSDDTLALLRLTLAEHFGAFIIDDSVGDWKIIEAKIYYLIMLAYIYTCIYMHTHTYIYINFLFT